MEIQLKNWINEYKNVKNTFPTKNQIKEKALELTEFKSSFKASKGWFEKFIARQFPELVDKTRKRHRKRRILLPTNKQIYKCEPFKVNRNANSVSVNNNVTRSTVEDRNSKLDRVVVMKDGNL